MIHELYEIMSKLKDFITYRKKGRLEKRLKLRMQIVYIHTRTKQHRQQYIREKEEKVEGEEEE